MDTAPKRSVEPARWSLQKAPQRRSSTCGLKSARPKHSARLESFRAHYFGSPRALRQAREARPDLQLSPGSDFLVATDPRAAQRFGLTAAMLAAQSTRSTSNRCRLGAACSDTSSPTHFPSRALPRGASLLMT